MKKIAVVYHSGQGHTEYIARCVGEGARGVPGVEVSLLKAESLAAEPERLTEFDGFIWGSPTYLGGVSGVFKGFMDTTGRLWRSQALKGRLAAGFTVSNLPSGDKQSTLLAMFVFSMQHGMLWAGNALLPEQHQGVPEEQAVNRLGSWAGLMAQAGHAAPADDFAPGDVRTARLFGRHVATELGRLTMPPRGAGAGLSGSAP